MENCGRRCIGAPIVEKAKRIKRNTKNLADLIDSLNKQYIGGGRLRLENNRINVEYGKCYCGMVSKNEREILIHILQLQ